MEEHNLLPNETRSYDHRYRREIQKERAVPLIHGLASASDAIAMEVTQAREWGRVSR